MSSINKKIKKKTRTYYTLIRSIVFLHFCFIYKQNNPYNKYNRTIEI